MLFATWAGYVAVTLLKQYQKPSPNPEVTLKRRLFVSVLRGMCAENQPESADFLTDCGQNSLIMVAFTTFETRYIHVYMYVHVYIMLDVYTCICSHNIHVHVCVITGLPSYASS